MRSTNAVFSVYIKELNRVWDYLSWSWGPCIPSKRAHISGHCSPWPWTVVGFTEPHDKWVFLAERTSPSSPFSQDHVQHMPQHSSESHRNALFIIDALVQSHDMKPTDRTLNKTSSNRHMSEIDIQDRTPKHTEKNHFWVTYGSCLLLPLPSSLNFQFQGCSFSYVNPAKFAWPTVFPILFLLQ